jgi:hypothetical protein
MNSGQQYKDATKEGIILGISLLTELKYSEQLLENRQKCRILITEEQF